MEKEFSIAELAELRSDLTYAAQKVERVVISRLSAKHREKHPEYYKPEDLITTRKELDLARFQLRTVSDKMLPALMALAQEGVPV